MLSDILAFLSDFWQVSARLFSRLLSAVLSHGLIAKPLFFVSVILGCVRASCGFFDRIFTSLSGFRQLVYDQISGLGTGHGFSVFPALSFVNSFFPVSEALQLSFALLGLWVAVLTVKSIMWVYNKIPLKAS